MQNHRDLPWTELSTAFQIHQKPIAVRRFATNGFSGTRHWQIKLPDASRFMIRQLPQGAMMERLDQTRQILKHVVCQGCDFVPLPLETSAGNAAICLSDRCWQLEPFFPGVANFRQRPTPARMKNAMQTLARWHRAAATIGGVESRSSKLVMQGNTAPGIASRLTRCIAVGRPGGVIDQIHRLASGGRLRSPIEVASSPFIAAFQKGAAELRNRLERASQLQVPIQYCIRDIHHEHLLFADASSDEISGVVDYDAVRMDSVAADLSRLLRSMLDGGPASWMQAISDYEHIRPLADSERELLAAFDESNRLLSGVQWLEWIVLEQRQFDWERVNHRLQEILAWL